jgi:hypothetical protein
MLSPQPLHPKTSAKHIFPAILGFHEVQNTLLALQESFSNAIKYGHVLHREVEKTMLRFPKKRIGKVEEIHICRRLRVAIKNCGKRSQ